VARFRRDHGKHVVRSASSMQMQSGLLWVMCDGDVVSLAPSSSPVNNCSQWDRANTASTIGFHHYGFTDSKTPVDGMIRFPISIKSNRCDASFHIESEVCECDADWSHCFAVSERTDAGLLMP
jgi:hypothetical protein